MKDAEFEETLSDLEGTAWNAFKAATQKSQGNKR